MFTINDPAVVEQVLALHEAYETALVGNDVETLTALFWDSEWALRFGAGESLYGSEEIERFRKSRPAVNLEREVFNLHIVTFGDAQAIVTLEFRRKAFGALRHGRQSQVWMRFAEGWKIVSAHVSFVPLSYMESASSMIGLPIPDKYAEEVKKNLEWIAGMAAPLLATPLPGDTESAAVFEP